MPSQYIEPIEKITALFENKQVKTLEDSIDLVKTQYDLLTSYFDTVEDELEKRWCIKYTIDKLLPILQRMMISPKVNETQISIVYQLYRKSYAFCGRRSLVHFVDFMEWDRPTSNKVYIKRKETLDIILFYLNKLALDDTMKKIAISLPPSYAKSFSGNYYTAWRFGMNIHASILRMSYGENLLNQFSRQIKDIMQSNQFAEIFPSFKYYNGRPFEKEKDSDWKIKNSDMATNHIVRTRDGQATGSRANSDIIFDDMTKGKEEANNDDLHKGIWQQYLTEWFNRKDDDNTKFIFLGTMWNPLDLLNMITQTEGQKSTLIPSKHFPYAWESEDGSFVSIRVPLLDEEGKSTCEKVTSTKEALFLQSESDPFYFACVYQQNPIAPSGLEFAYENLRTYEDLPNTLNNYSFAVLDPTRKGIDNISMPISKCDIDGENHYVIDWLYKKIAMTEAYDLIIDKIIQHHIIKLVIENNTDTSLKSILEMKLKNAQIFDCIIYEKYNVKKKEIRIKDMRGIMLRRMIFKKKGMAGANSDYGRAMSAFTSYSFDYANKNDDAPDSVALYVSEIIESGSKGNSFEILSRKTLGI
jgi:predicted phage terminase large subunit-like protein